MRHNILLLVMARRTTATATCEPLVQPWKESKENQDHLMSHIAPSPTGRHPRHGGRHSDRGDNLLSEGSEDV